MNVEGHDRVIAERAIGWDHPATAAYYQAFCRSHRRYQRANQELVARASLGGDIRVLDLGAGTGLTTRAALGQLGRHARVVCVEPSEAMRAAGMTRVGDPRVTWRATIPRDSTFERILCGAAVWQMQPLATTFRRLARRLRPGGRLCFTIPAAYLQESDVPGGGRDPLLLELPAQLVHTNQTTHSPAGAWYSVSRGSHPASGGRRQRSTRRLTATRLADLLRRAGLEPASWTFRSRLTQTAYAAWLKIPVVTNGMLAGLPPDERARRVDEALRHADRSSWKWEQWRVWIARTS